VIEIRRILCPTDLSEVSQRAFADALALARWYRSEIKLLYVVEPLLAGPGGTLPWPSWTLLNPGVRERLLASLQEMAEPAAAVGVRVQCEVGEGSPFAEILDEARSMPADVLVMGTHGRGGFQRFVLGSVTEKVMRRSPCPVLTVPPPSEHLPIRESLLFGRILCPVDFSASSLHALRYAFSLAEESCAELVLLHVLEWPLEDQLTGATAWFDAADDRRRYESDVRERLHGAVPDEVRDWCRPSEAIATGKPGREILRVAEERRSQLIVMGVRGRGPVDLAVFGSTTQHVVRAAHCPVLVIHTD
jgi:nucleotide-binding universal stress UspA family protein